MNLSDSIRWSQLLTVWVTEKNNAGAASHQTSLAFSSSRALDWLMHLELRKVDNFPITVSKKLNKNILTWQTHYCMLGCGIVEANHSSLPENLFAIVVEISQCILWPIEILLRIFLFTAKLFFEEKRTNLCWYYVRLSIKWNLSN